MASRNPKPQRRSGASRRAAELKLVDALIALLAEGSVPWRREWDGSAAGHHVNLVSGRRYRGTNPVLLTLGMLQRGFDLPYWCGFAEARAMGVWPRPGSRAVHVLRPRQHRREEARHAATAAAETVSAVARPTVEASTWVTFRPMPLFNVAELEGEALHGLIEARRAAEAWGRRPEPERLTAAEVVLAAWPVPVHFGGDRACYLPGPDRIVLPDRQAFCSAAALYSTWAHEAIHSSGHSSRLARDLSGGMGDAGDGGRSYAREELVAELGAVLLGDRLEIGSAMANHAAYLGHWIDLLQDSPQLLLEVLGDARRAADLICPEVPTLERPLPGSSATLE